MSEGTTETGTKVKKTSGKKKGAKPDRVRAWCFTINNPESNELFSDPLPEDIYEEVRYVIWQLEEGLEEHTPHLQGYIEFFTLKSRKQVQYTLGYPTCHVEQAKGSGKQNKDYCSKSLTRVAGPWEIGEMSHQGRSTDLAAAVNTLRKTGSLKAVAEQHPLVMVKHSKGLNELATYLPHIERSEVRIVIIYGPSQIGKSWNVDHRFTDEQLFEPVITKDGQMWFSGYSGQEVLFIDEFRPSKIPLGDLNRLMDATKLTKETKGNVCKAAWHTIILTTNFDPKTWYHEMRNDPRSRMHWNSMQERVKKSILLDFSKYDGDDPEVTRNKVISAFDKLREWSIAENGDYDFMPPLRVVGRRKNFFNRPLTITLDDVTDSTPSESDLQPPPTKVTKIVTI